MSGLANAFFLGRAVSESKRLDERLGPRARGVPFLGTCARFQHAAIEYARSVLGLANADHAESNPAAPLPVIAPLSHPWVGRTGAVVLDPASHAARIYRRTEVAERYRCNFGLNPEYLVPLHVNGLRVAGVDAEGTAAVLAFGDHPFFVATLFMPEQRSRPDAPHPLITAYLAAAAGTSRGRRARGHGDCLEPVIAAAGAPHFFVTEVPCGAGRGGWPRARAPHDASPAAAHVRSAGSGSPAATKRSATPLLQ